MSLLFICSLHLSLSLSPSPPLPPPSLYLSLSLVPPPPSLSSPHSRASPAPHGIHPSQIIQAKGPQQQLPTPATPLAPNQGNYASVSQPHQPYTHPMGTVPPSSASTGYSMQTGGGSQMMYGTGNVPMGQPRMQQGQGTSVSECMILYDANIHFTLLCSHE